MLSTSDPLYVIKSQSNALAYWLNSSSDYNYGYIYDYVYVMVAAYNGDVAYGNFNNNLAGFRPLVCLKSNVKLQKVSDTQYAIQ